MVDGAKIVVYLKHLTQELLIAEIIARRRKEGMHAKCSPVSNPVQRFAQSNSDNAHDERRTIRVVVGGVYVSPEEKAVLSMGTNEV